MVSELLEGFTGTEKIFAAFAFVGTLFFLLRMFWMMIAGLGDFGDADMDGGGDGGGLDGGDGGGMDGGDAGHGHGTDASFRLVSLNSLTGFFMMFGWVGLACSKQYGLGMFPSVVMGFLAGGLTMLGTAYLVKMMLRLQDQGQRFHLGETVGHTASVYLKIPAKGRGKVRITLGEVSRQFDAIAENGKEIESFTNVKVERVVDDQTLSVSMLPSPGKGKRS